MRCLQRSARKIFLASKQVLLAVSKEIPDRGLTRRPIFGILRDMTTTQTTRSAYYTDAEAVAIARTITEQVGRGNVRAISGGRMSYAHDDEGVELILPCGYGYEVRIRYTIRDTYTVIRGYRKGLSYWIKGEMTDIYLTEVGEVAYRAGMFRDEWTTEGARKVV